MLSYHYQGAKKKVKARTQVNDPKKGLKEMEEDLKKKTSKKRSDEKSEKLHNHSI
jgi:hypothetical protein